MPSENAPIGVIDSGVGGLTVVQELQRLLPGEDILYFGDSANCPYGNKTADQIAELSGAMLRFLHQRGVKCVAVACNTTSSLVERLRPAFPFEIVSIVEAAARAVAQKDLHSVGLLATEFTVSSGKYDELIHRLRPDCRVIGKGSPRLAALIDRGDFDAAAIDDEIRMQVSDILSRGTIESLILGCTHYPIAEDAFRRCYPHLPLLNPAQEQAAAVRTYLQENRLCAKRDKGRFTIFTTGEASVFRAVADRLGLVAPDTVETVR